VSEEVRDVQLQEMMYSEMSILLLRCVIPVV